MSFYEQLITATEKSRAELLAAPIIADCAVAPAALRAVEPALRAGRRRFVLDKRSGRRSRVPPGCRVQMLARVALAVSSRGRNVTIMRYEDRPTQVCHDHT